MEIVRTAVTGDAQPPHHAHTGRSCQSCGQPLHDLPTGLLERWRWDELAASTLSRVRHQNWSAALLVIDLDRFKEINDEYGHPAGDAVLQAVADLLCEQTRDEDLACRYGGYAGDEFLVLLVRTGMEEALSVAERIRAGIAGLSVTTKVTRELSATISGHTASIGVAAYCPVDLAELGLEDLLLDADAALRAAKRRGRDRICLANVDLTEENESRTRAGRRRESWSRFRRLRSV
jgi:diguanylate cyclase (GGDEF)-like protein